ncbi:cytosolic carboxypeptidase 4 isoform X2 [Dendropsophus ebraccatus]|uniref:cytosolic carboxypeptidase 4 isoform X2 n=1 Tax=Dendropsophus ebraccatus TaxID=150705 RepID=UPI003831C9A7
MASEGSSGLQVLLSTLQNSCEKDVTLNILSVLSELLSAGTHRRIHYMISKGGSEALLQTLVNFSRSEYLDYGLILPLLRLMVKVGQRDGNFGEKAQKLEATDVTLSLIRRNLTKPDNVTPCLYAIQVYAANVSVGEMLGINGAMELLFKIITPYTRRHAHSIKASVGALAALLKSKSNIRRAVNRGYVCSLLQFYQDWHSSDSANHYMSIRRGFLRCIKHITNVRSGREAFHQANGMEIIYTTAQECLQCKSLDPLVSAAVQVLRKCCPKFTLPLSCISSSYTFLVPGKDKSKGTKIFSQEDESEDDDEDITTNLTSDENKEEDDDLETDVKKLKYPSQPDRPVEEFEQYKAFCSELSELQVFKANTSDVEEVPNATENISSVYTQNIPSTQRCMDDCYTPVDRLIPGDTFLPKTHKEQMVLKTICSRQPLMDDASINKQEQINTENNLKNPSCLCSSNTVCGEPSSFSTTCIETIKVKHSDVADESENHKVVKQLLEQHKGNIPFHDPNVYMSIAGNTKSVPDYKVLAFPDFWGHCSPPFSQKLAEKKYGSQRDNIFEDIQRFLRPRELLNRVVFDLDNPSVAEGSERISCLKFFSKFESGNLRKVMQVREFEYDLIMNADVNTDQHHQWFYFEVSAMRANVPYRFNVINCEKVNSQFNYGMQPVIYSVKESLQGKTYWMRTGTNICYYKNLFCYRASDAKKRRRYYTLTFTVKFPHYGDVCYLAYHYPYTYSALVSHLQILKQRCNPERVYFKQQTLCHTLGGNPCPIVTITAMPKSDSQSQREEIRSRQYMVLTARVHPGESNASWVMKGTLEFLTSDDSTAQILREMFIFKIIPMLNPDGVINGNHRCSLNGEDLNRQWLSPKCNLQPTIYHVKGLLYYLNSIGRTPLVFCDYHGHSQRKNVFFYGCSIKETLWQAGCVVDSSVLLEDVGYRTLPKILDKIAPAFSMSHSSFLVEKARASTARVVVWHDMRVLRSYTMESTYCGFSQGPYKGLQVGTKELEEMGAKFCLGLLILQTKSFYSGTLHPQVEALLEVEREGADNHRTSTETDDEPPCEEEIDYNTDSCSDPEVLETDAKPEDKLSEQDHGARKTQSPTSTMKEEAFTAKCNCSTIKSLTVSSKQYGCSPEASSSLCEQSFENSSKTQMGHYLY